GFVPTHTLKRARAFRPYPAQGVEHAIRTVDALQVVVDFGTQDTLCVGMIGITDEVDRDPVLDRDVPGASVGTIMGTGTAYVRGRWLMCAGHRRDLLKLLIYRSPWARVSKCYFPINGSIPRDELPFIWARGLTRNALLSWDVLRWLEGYGQIPDNEDNTSMD